MSKTPWRRVSKRERCPICDRPDWCLVTGPEGSPEAAICARTESTHRIGESGWLHQIRANWQPSPARTVSVPVRKPPPSVSFQDAASRYEAAVSVSAVKRLADELGVSVLALRSLRIGWSTDHGAWTFPMTDVSGHVHGIRLRLPNGRKLAVRGGHEGLFVPITLPVAVATLVICEGPTDCAALLDLGFDAIGRPNCDGGVRMIVELVRRWHVADGVILADADESGQRGARNLAAVLVAYCKSVRIIRPPAEVKDAREWKQRGAIREEVQLAIETAPLIPLTLSVGKAVRHGRR